MKKSVHRASSGALRRFSPVLAISLFLILSGRARLVRAQGEDVHATGSNLLRYGEGHTGDETDQVRKHYLEEIANARIFFQYFTLGLRYEMDDPSEVGRSFQGIRRRWIQYKKNALELQAGDVNALFGRGLAVNLFESRPLNFDTWLDGVYVQSEYKVPKDWLSLDAAIKVKGVAGKTDFYSVIDTTAPVNHISARSANAEFSFFNRKLLLGTSFLEASNTIDPSGAFGASSYEVDQPEIYADLNSGEVEAFAEWTTNRNRVNKLYGTPVDTSHAGSAFYSSLSYSNSLFGLTVEYKNYNYFRHNQNADIYENIFSKLPITNPPEVYKEFTYTSITRTTHAVFFDDEVGLEAEANITAIPNVTINLNAAASSRHEKYDANGVATDSLRLFPNFSDYGFYPFWEAFAEVEWEFDPENELNYIRFAAHRRSDVIVYNPYDVLGTDRKRTTTIAAKLQYVTTPTQSMLVILEHQWEYDYSRHTADKNVLNELATLQYSFNPLLTFGTLIDMAVQYENMPLHLENIWVQGFASVRLGESHTLLVSYGAERGGLNCTGGICRQVPAFNGLRVTLTSQI